MKQGDGSMSQDPSAGPGADDLACLERAIALAESAAREGNLPIGAVIMLDGKMLSEGRNSVLRPEFHPGRHAEIEALNAISGEILHKHSKRMVLYTNIEPCVMCLGAIILHRIGRVVFGAIDPRRGAGYLHGSLLKIYQEDQLPRLVGPLLQDRCAAMFLQADKIYRDFRDSGT
jgi:tRNA(adenine34) deaminase